MNTNFTLAARQRRRIMRQVWGWYIYSVVTTKACWQGVVLGASITALFQLVSVGIIIRSFFSRTVVEWPEYSFSLFYRAFSEGEFILLLVCLAIVASLFMSRHLVLPTMELPFTLMRPVR